MSNFKNSRQSSRLSNFVTASIEDENCLLVTKCKFNFGYFDYGKKSGQNFKQWKHSPLIKLLERLQEYGKEPLCYWEKEGNLTIYGDFPKHSEFKRPQQVPHEALWGRFRLGSTMRLCGFVIPNKFDTIKHSKTGKIFDSNTFYVVFLDNEHQFYPSKR